MHSRRRNPQVSPPPTAHGVVEVDRSGAPVVRVHAQPGASRTAVVGRHGDALKVRVAAPPAGGRANSALTAVLADVLDVSPAAVELVSGASARRKRFRIAGADPDVVAARLAAAIGA